MKRIYSSAAGSWSRAECVTVSISLGFDYLTSQAVITTVLCGS